jgi:GntR family transcriptional regulator/MocR family aminotransferase
LATPAWEDLVDLGAERDSTVPLYRQLYLGLRKAILDRRLRPGTKLPSTRGLADRLGVARMSVVTAYEQLLAEGYTVGRVGAGTFVSADLPEPVAAGVVEPARRNLLTTPRVARRADRLGVDLEPDATERVPFGTGFGHVDLRTLDAWRKLTMRAMREPGRLDLGYSDPQGLSDLRLALCNYLRAARGVRCEPEQIIVTAGSQQAIDLAIRVVLDPGDAVWVEDPCYPLTHAALTAAGMQVHPVPVDGHGIDIVQGTALAFRARAAFVTPSNQFPLGMMLSMARRLELLAWAREANAWIVEDDYDSEFRYAGRPLAALQGLDDGERTIYVGTFSKVLFPGLRLGYAVVPPSVLRNFVAARILVDRHPPVLNQLVAAEFIREGHFTAHLRRTRLTYRAHRDAAVAALTQELGETIELVPPDQGKHLIAYLSDSIPDCEVQQAAAHRGVTVRPLSPLYRKARPRSGLILGFTGYPASLMAPAAARLASGIHQRNFASSRSAAVASSRLNA